MQYTEENRGHFQARDRAKQLVSFENMQIGSITPTDSDGEIEYHNKAWIFFEIKFKYKDVPLGQKIALERKIDDITKSGKEAVLFLADHFVGDASQDIDAASCVVRTIYYKGKWWKSDGSDLKSYVNRFIGMVDGFAA